MNASDNQLRGQLEDAIIFITNHYRNHIDVDNRSSILHILRVMLNVPKDLNYQVTALFHDLLSTENGLSEAEYEAILNNIREQFGDQIAEAVHVLNYSPDTEPYRNYLKRVINNDIARVVKIADLKDEIKMLWTVPTESNLTMLKICENALQILGGE